MRWYQRAGQPIPQDWALTPDGEPTTDPDAAMDGPLLPIGAYKGYGLSLVSDVLSGVMTGALFGLSVFQNDRHYDVCHLMLAISPEAFMPRAEFERRLGQLIKEIKAAPPIDPERPVMLPGEIEHQRLAQRRREGIPMDQETVDRLQKLSSDIGVAFPL